MSKDTVVNEYENSDIKLLYGLDERPPLQKNIVFAAQHVIFIMVSAVLMPLVIGALLGLSQYQIAAMLQRTFVLCGIISIFQAKFGHGYPIIDGPAGLWTGIFALMAGLAPSLGKDLSILRTDLEGGMLIAGCVVAVLALSGFMSKILKLFTPVVNSVLITLMVLQLSPSVVKGMMAVENNVTVLDPRSVAVFVSVLAIIVGVNLFGKGILQSVSVLIGVIAGCILAELLGVSSSTELISERVFMLPEIFSWGMPTFDPGVVVTCIFAALVLLSMTFTSVNATADVLGEEVTERQLSKSLVIHGVSTVFSGILPTVAFMPYISSVGVITMTKVASRSSFILAGIMMIILGILSPVGMFFASIPMPVGCSALLVVFSLILGQGIKEFQKIKITNRESYIIGISILLGTGAMFLPDTAFMNLPSVARYILSNGLVDGILMALVLDRMLPLVE